jgi:hypothetical protein
LKARASPQLEKLKKKGGLPERRERGVRQQILYLGFINFSYIRG